VGLKWDLLATLLIAWGIVYLIICKGLHASGKVKTTFILGLLSSTTIVGIGIPSTPPL
jgi:hypothetical protein